MARKSKGKRSKKDGKKNLRYKAEKRREANKVRKIDRELTRLIRIKGRNPDSKVDATISQLEETKKKWTGRLGK